MHFKSTQGCHSCSLDWEHVFQELHRRFGNRSQLALSLINNNFGSQHSCSCSLNQGLNDIFMKNCRLRYPMSDLQSTHRLSLAQAPNSQKYFPYGLQDTPRERERTPGLNFLERAHTKGYPLKRLDSLPEDDMKCLSKEDALMERGDFTKKSIQGKRKFWLPGEDAQLIELVHMYGEKWSKIASIMQGRTGKQIRDRYINSLKPGIRQEAWTPAEDELLVRLYKKIGNKWSRIAHCLKGRTENQVKNRFRTCFKKSLGKVSKENFRSESDSVDSLKRTFDEDDEEEFDVKVLEESREEQETSAGLKEEELDLSTSHCLVSSRPLQLEIQGYNQFTAPRKVLHTDEDRVLDQGYLNKRSPLEVSMRTLSPNAIPQYIFSANNFSNQMQNRIKVPCNLEHFESVRLQKSLNIKLYEESSVGYVKEEEYSNLDTDSSNVKEEYINVKYE